MEQIDYRSLRPQEHRKRLSLLQWMWQDAWGQLIMVIVVCSMLLLALMIFMVATIDFNMD